MIRFFCVIINFFCATNSITLVGRPVRILVEDAVAEVGPLVHQHIAVGAEGVQSALRAHKVLGREVEVERRLAAARRVVDHVGCVEDLGGARLDANVGALKALPCGVLDAVRGGVLAALAGFVRVRVQLPGVRHEDCYFFEEGSTPRLEGIEGSGKKLFERELFDMLVVSKLGKACVVVDSYN